MAICRPSPGRALGRDSNVNWGIFKRYFWGELLRHQQTDSVPSYTGTEHLGGSGGLPGLRVLSCRSPSTPSCLKRSCQRQTTGFDFPDRRITSKVPQLSAVARMMLARQTCFCGALRCATIA